MLHAELAFRKAAAHGCQPAAAGRFWAVFDLLTPAEQSSYTGRPGVLTRLRRPLHESEEAATTRFGDLVADLVTWAKAQYTTAPAGQQQRTPRQEAAWCLSLSCSCLPPRTNCINGMRCISMYIYIRVYTDLYLFLAGIWACSVITLCQPCFIATLRSCGGLTLSTAKASRW